MATEDVLASLQRIARQEGSAEATDIFERHRGAVIPEDLIPTGEEHEFEHAWLTVSGGDLDALLEAEAAVETDLRFEHLVQRSRGVQDAVWRFVCEAYLDHSQDLVPAFVGRHERPIVATKCFFLLKFLKVEAPFRLAGVDFLPASDERVPHVEGFASENDAVVAVETSGTHPRRMMERARPFAEHAVRILRLGLREHRTIANDQLLFEVASVWAFESGGMGWQRSTPIKLLISPELVALVEGQRASRLPHPPSNDLERRVGRAIQWLDKARFMRDKLDRALALFNALEWMLGSKDEGLKSCGLALRRAVLGEVAGSGTLHPALIEAVYAKVRSHEVHGSWPEDLPERTVTSLEWSLRTAVNEILAFADANGFTKRSQVNAALLGHPVATQWLTELRPSWLPADQLGKVSSPWMKFRLPSEPQG